MSRDIAFLEKKAKQLRLDVLETVYNAQSGHIGGSFSMMEALVALYYDFMNVDSEKPKDENRDRFVLSKGHTAPGLYVVLADRGFFPREWLKTSFRSINSKLQGHPDMVKTPGVEMTSGSLGIGLSAANGMALAAKIRCQSYKVYCMIGDGEIDEGQIWEAAATSAHHRLDNVIAFVDLNGLQNDGPTCEVLNMESVEEKWKAFGWYTQSIGGHDFNELFQALDNTKNSDGKPSVIIMHTRKGKGVSFMENVVGWHGKTPTKEDYEKAKKELIS